jgi:hypothetical protein
MTDHCRACAFICVLPCGTGQIAILRKLALVRRALGPDPQQRQKEGRRWQVRSTKPVAVSRRISAPARDIFQLLADPGRHPDLDGSGMLREAVSRAIVAGVGDVFVMKMYRRDRNLRLFSCAGR